MKSNLEAYNAEHVLKWYKNLHGLMPVEKMIFEDFKGQLAVSHTLHIGIGSGRTTATCSRPQCTTLASIIQKAL